MLDSWNVSPGLRPNFSDLVDNLDRILSLTLQGVSSHSPPCAPQLIHNVLLVKSNTAGLSVKRNV